MPAATIVAVKATSTQVCLSARVTEQDGETEYTGCVPNDATFAALTTAQKKAALVTATKAVRDAQLAAPADVAGISGSVNL